MFDVIHRSLALSSSRNGLFLHLLSPFRGLRTAVLVVNGRTMALQLHFVATDNNSALAAVISM